MSSSSQNWLSHLIAKPRSVFLMDSIGAMLTAFSHGIVMVHFQKWFGMPQTILKILGLVAVGFAIYSLLCFLFLKKTFKPFLVFIMLANFTFCLISLYFVWQHWNELEWLSFIYFPMELIIVGVVIYIEKRTYDQCGT